MAAPSFFWYDLETYGLSFANTPIVQFAGIRTDGELRRQEEVNLLCRPPPDLDLDIYSIKIHRISPRRAQRDGLPESEFAGLIYEQLARPGTCSVGYNSVSFDNEFVRHLFFRNFLPVYWHEFKQGCSKWDLINLARMLALLRPQTLNIDLREGRPSFALANLARLNGFSHDDPHDALSDVEAALALARKIKSEAPAWFEYFFAQRGKSRTLDLINRGEPLLYVAGDLPRRHHCAAMVLPVAPHPVYSNYFICFDLRYHPNIIAPFSAAEIHTRYFADAKEEDNLPAKLGLRMLKLNKCPMLAPLSELQLRGAELPRIFDTMKLRRQLAEEHLQDLMRQRQEFAAKIKQAFAKEQYAAGRREQLDAPANSGGRMTSANSGPTAEAKLYEGFVEDADLAAGRRLRALSPAELARQGTPPFSDRRLNEIFPRYKGRNFPAALSAAELAHWREYLRRRLGALLPDKIREVREALLTAEQEERGPLQETLAYYNELTDLAAPDSAAGQETGG